MASLFTRLLGEGVDDLVMCSNPSNDEITNQLKARYARNLIYTNIGEVLVAVNPYKQLPIYGDEHISMYQLSSGRENSPHIFALAEQAYRTLVNEGESQSVIISGESGAGKTESAKLLLKYITSVSGETAKDVHRIKQVIMDSNPILEAIGNAKTIRNNNSSRFGKYLEIQFSEQGEPVGAVVTNFLLEKSRVTFQQKNERNFHIFYQLLAGAPQNYREDFGLQDPEVFEYLNKCTKIDNVDDAADFEEVVTAMNTVGISADEQYNIFRVFSAILYLGNIAFEGDAPAKVVNRDWLDFAAYLLGVKPEDLGNILVHRSISTGSKRGSVYAVPQNSDQAAKIRDALAKALYSRVFDYIVECINKSMRKRQTNKLVIGVLDIYGFEVFDRNGFEQFCINYVNERLQQIFIDLTLKKEQEEYHEENMKWKDIDYFDNKLICDLIEAEKPPGIFRLLDDVCRTAHSENYKVVDEKFVENLYKGHGTHPHLVIERNIAGSNFLLKHYAGKVNYTVDEFTIKNNDNLYPNIILGMQATQVPFVKALFPENVRDDKKAPTTAGYKIRQSSAQLIEALRSTTPHYIRCIKPNDEKKPGDFVTKRVKHQVKYLGLLENVRVKRAGYAYRHYFDIFLNRFSCLKDDGVRASGREGCEELMKYLKGKISSDEWEVGKTKIFVKSPETIFLLEEEREKKLDPEGYALKIQNLKEQEKLAKQTEKKGVRGGKGSTGLQQKCMIQ